MRKYYLLLAVAFFLFTINSDCSQGAAWTQAKGGGQLILNLSAYKSYKYYDLNSEINKSDITFKKVEFNPFFEFGITDTLTVGMSQNIQYWNFDNPSNNNVNNIRQCQIDSAINSTNVNRSNLHVLMTDMEVFARKQLYLNGGFVFSLQPLIKTPCVMYINGYLQVPQTNFDYEIRALAGYGFKWQPDINLGSLKVPFAGQNHFVNFESAYRKRSPKFADQFRLDASAGFRYNKDLLVLNQIFSTFSAYDKDVYVSSLDGKSDYVFEDDYYSVKLQISLAKQMTKNSSLQFGAFSEVAGKNSGQGDGLILSMWYRF